MFGKLKRCCSAIGGFIKRHPLMSVIILVAVLVALTLVSYEVMHLTSKPEFCKKCHPKEGTGPLAEYDTWSKNIHAANGVECLDCHSIQPGAVGYIRAKMGGLYDLAMEIALSDEKKLEMLSKYEGDYEHSAKLVPWNVCLHCHSTEINEKNREKHFMTFMGVAMRQLDKVKNPEFLNSRGMNDILADNNLAGVNAKHSVHIYQKIECARCHEKVAHSGEFRSPLKMQTCFTCHDEMRATGATPPENDSCETCHAGQVGIQDGNVAQAYVEDGSRWYMRDLGCSSCHEDPFVRPTKAVCMNCHDDTYQDLMVTFQDDYNTMFEEANKFYMDNLPNESKMSEDQRKAFNTYKVLFSIVTKDGSKGVHNPDYITQIFDKLTAIRDEFNK